MAEGDPSVSTVELFFDLVFVFTITQLTHLVEAAHDVQGFVAAFLTLTIIWWHYAGYVWLTNATGAHGRMRLVLIAAMAGFLVMAVSLPAVFGAGDLAFGLAYLFVVLLHLGAFAAQGGRPAFRAVLGLAPINLGAAAFVLAAGIVDAPWDWALFGGALGMFAISTMIRREGGFQVRPRHFAERHGLVMLIALGESIIAIGSGGVFDAWTLGAIVLGLALIAAIWWTYFDVDDVRAEHHLQSASPAERPRLALVGYWYTHLFMIAGVVVVATGIHEAVAHPAEASSHAAWLLAAGVAIYLAGDALFRRFLKIPGAGARFAAAIAALLAGFAGALPALVVLALVCAVVVAHVAIEAIRAHATRSAR